MVRSHRIYICVPSKRLSISDILLHFIRYTNSLFDHAHLGTRRRLHQGHSSRNEFPSALLTTVQVWYSSNISSVCDKRDVADVLVSGRRGSYGGILYVQQPGGLHSRYNLVHI